MMQKDVHDVVDEFTAAGVASLLSLPDGTHPGGGMGQDAWGDDVEDDDEE